MRTDEPSEGLLWERVDALIDRAPSEADIRGHRLEVLAARRLRSRALPIPEDFAALERLAAIVSMTAPLVLSHVRAAYDAPTIVMKGPELAAYYPETALRWYGDIDLLVEDVAEAQQALLAAGFEEVGAPELYVGIHHVRPLRAPGTPLPVELHSRPKWFGPSSPPRTDELFAAAVPGTTGVPGMLALPPEEHVVLLAAHSWAHEPLRRLRDLVDIAAVVAHGDRARAEALAEAWGVGRLWKTTLAAVDAVFADRRTPWSMRVWAQNLRRVHERTVLENHLQRWLSDFFAMPPADALARVPKTLTSEIRPAADESWRDKLLRMSLAFRNATQRRSVHERAHDERRDDRPSAGQSA
jgi:hypothetical protein